MAGPTLACGSLRQEDHEFKPSLEYIARLSELEAGEIDQSVSAGHRSISRTHIKNAWCGAQNPSAEEAER